MSEKIINNFTIKAYFDPSIVYPSILKLFPEGRYEQLLVCDQSVIKFGNKSLDYATLPI